MSASLARPVGVLLLGLALAACGTSGSPTPTAFVSPTPTAMASQMPMESGGMETDIGALGEPADAAAADRTIKLTATDALVFEPDAIEVQVGETVTFEIDNTGTVDHEFVLGSADYQEEHEAEMQSGEMAMGEPNELEVPAGETASLTWHFTEAGTTEYGCHEPGHFPAGMVGTITVSE